MSRVWLRMAGTSEATKIFVLPKANHNRRARARGNDLIRVAAGNHADRKHARDLFDRLTDRVLQVAVEMLFHQVRDYFGIGFGFEVVAFGRKLFAELR